jgi:hypothetical protein
VGVPMKSSVLNFLELFQTFWGFWPLMILAALVGTLNRSRKRKLGSNIVHNILLAWGLFAILWVILTITGYPPPGFIIPQPLNNGLFWTIGLGLIVLKAREVVSERSRMRQKTQNIQDVNELTNLSSAEFEGVVAETYRAIGNRVEIVAAQGDHGIDIIVYSPKGEKYAVQCKKWKGKVGEPIVRDFYGAMQHENAVEGSIVTTGTFTPQAREWAKDKPIRLFDGDEFLKVLRRAQKTRISTPNPVERRTAIPTNQPPNCPRCGSSMVLRTARTGFHQGEQFFGCSNYPKCQGIVPVEGINIT